MSHLSFCFALFLSVFASVFAQSPYISIKSSNFTTTGDWTTGSITTCIEGIFSTLKANSAGSTISIFFQGTGIGVFGFCSLPDSSSNPRMYLDDAFVGNTPQALSSARFCDGTLYQNQTLESRLHNLTFVVDTIPPSETFTIVSLKLYNELSPSGTSTSSPISTSSSSPPSPPSSSPSSTSPSSSDSISPSATESPHSQTGAKVGGAIGGVVALLAAAAAATYLHLKAPTPGAVPDREFVFLPLMAPVIFRGKRLENVEITIVLEAPRLSLMNQIPNEKWSDDNSSRHTERVAWKVITFSIGKESTTVRLPNDLGFGGVTINSSGSQQILDRDFSCFAPLRTVVTKTQFWKSAKLRKPKMAPVVLATNAANVSEDFALGTYHAKKNRLDDIFSPFQVIRKVEHGQFCIAPQSKDLRVNAYVTQKIQERQILPGLPDSSEPSGSTGNYPQTASPSESGQEGDPDSAPSPTIEDDESPKVINNPPLLGPGVLVSELKQRTAWRLEERGGNLKLTMEKEGDGKTAPV